MFSASSSAFVGAVLIANFAFANLGLMETLMKPTTYINLGIL
jgi:hypothetical protein